MAGTWGSERFPHFEAWVRRLAEQHRQLQDEPLHLALAYGPDRDPQDIFLLEVIDTGNGDRLSQDRELFETVFAPTPGSSLNAGQRLHLVLTTPAELETAMHEAWPSAVEVRRAIESGNYQILSADDVGRRVLDGIRPETRRKEGAASG